MKIEITKQTADTAREAIEQRRRFLAEQIEQGNRHYGEGSKWSGRSIIQGQIEACIAADNELISATK